MSAPRMLKFRFQPTPRKLKATLGPGSGPEGRIMRLRQVVTAMVRFERLEMSYPRADEARGYVERLIHDAIKNGDRHKATMDMADFWLLEKDLIHKLFKVLVPRYHNSSSAFTSIYKLPAKYPGGMIDCGLLELKGNPWPPVRPQQRNLKNSLVNVLLQEAAKEYKPTLATSGKDVLSDEKAESILKDMADLKIGETGEGTQV
ncbi:large ribosomal subunit protein bL17m-like [Lineus longissimus]|uniref:large ribosomal subunit protein bL17m-like n=1 Tax=Lineus longissimus TaxID=88925 RepID=UPI002B4F1091